MKEGIRGDHSKNSINKKPPPSVYQYLAEGSVNEVLVYTVAGAYKYNVTVDVNE